METDLPTLLVACALAVLTVTTVFAATAALRHNDEANRAWVAGFASALCFTGLTAIYGADETTPAVVRATIDASSVFAVGAIWSGARLLDGRSRSLVWCALIAAAGATLPALLGGSQPDLAASATVGLGLTGVFAWLGASELMRGDMRLNLNGRILQAALLLAGTWFLVIAAVFAAIGNDPDRWPPLQSAVLPFTALFIIAAICLSALRVERSGNWWSMSAEARRRTTLSVLTSEPFREDARDRIERATMAGRHVALVLAEIDDLDELNSAFGRQTGDRAMTHFVQVLRSHVPVSALIGHLGAGRFAVLVEAPAAETPANVVAAIRTGLIDAALADDLEIRTDATFGTSRSADAPATFEALLAAASTDLDRSRAREN